MYKGASVGFLRTEKPSSTCNSGGKPPVIFILTNPFIQEAAHIKLEGKELLHELFEWIKNFDLNMYFYS